jgi:hypothetical protein
MRVAPGAAALLLATAALAYVPSLPSLLRRAATHPDGVDRSRDVTLKGMLRLDAGPASPASLRLHFPLRCRLQTEASSGPALAPGAINVRGQPGAQRVDTEGANLGAARELLSLACPLLTFKTGKAAEGERNLRAIADAAGTRLEPSTLGRLGERAVFVLGAPPRQLEVPQLWLYKDEMAPARLIAAGDGSLSDVRLFEYGTAASNQAFPRVIELWKGDKLAARFESLEAGGRRAKGTGDEEE